MLKKKITPKPKAEKKPKEKKYKIPGKKGYVSEDEFRKWTNSIPDER